MDEESKRSGVGRGKSSKSGLRRSSRSNVTNARRVAFDTLLRISTDNAYSSSLIASRSHTSLSSEDRGLANEITLGVLRWQGLLDYFIERYAERSIQRMDLPVVIALRIGIYQLRFLDRVPAAAAVNESVKLVRRSRTSSATGMVNAVLRRTADNTGDQPGENVDDPLARLSIAVSHPKWMLEKWSRDFGGLSRAESIALANNRPGRLSFRLNKLRDAGRILEWFESRGVRLRRSTIASGGFVLEEGPASEVIKAAEEGIIYIQDEASQLVSELVDPQPGELILDLCAAPGSKATHLSELSHDRADVICCDVHWRRLLLLQASSRRLGLTHTYALACDGTQPLPFAEDLEFDRILVDAPCSGTGTLRQNPEIKWRLSESDISRLGAIQIAIVERAAARLKKGGSLIYSTCSIEPEENEQIVDQVLSTAFEVTVPEVPQEMLTSRGFVRIFPDTHATEGFFIAALRKVG